MILRAPNKSEYITRPLKSESKRINTERISSFFSACVFVFAVCTSLMMF